MKSKLSRRLCPVWLPDTSSGYLSAVIFASMMLSLLSATLSESGEPAAVWTEMKNTSRTANHPLTFPIYIAINKIDLPKRFSLRI